MINTEQREVAIKALISYPREAEVGQTYLVTVDVETDIDKSGRDWPYAKEEYALYCILDTEPLFTHESVGKPTIILNRFGGSYGPATFLLTAATQLQSGAMAVTLINEQGMPLHQVTLPDINIVWETKKPARIKKLEPDIPTPKPPQSIKS